MFNLPFWRTLGASTDTNAVHNTLGTGLSRTNDGMLVITDPTHAYLELTADGTSGYLRVDTTSQEAIDKAYQRAEAESKANGDKAASSPLGAIHVRVDVADATGRATSLSPGSERSHYLRADGKGRVRVWIQEAKGSVVPIGDVRANVRVPFAISWMRIGAMAMLSLALALWRPGSRLWRIPFDPASGRQRLAFAGIMAIPVVVLGVAIVQQLAYGAAPVFHVAGGYTYDFNQYGHTADSLIAGRTWLDLPVPDALAATADPYDVTTRSKLLAQGVTPLYWDYAYYQGHWYSYFGVLPAVVLFAPYKLLTGRTLPTAAAELFLMLLFIIFFTLLVLRVIHRVMPKTSLAAASLITLSCLLGSQLGYMLYRTNFYQVPLAASLTLTSLGLWFWMGATTTHRPVLPSDRWQVGKTAPLSLPRLALGAWCIAANFGCRPTFTLTALLAFPTFWPQIRAMVSELKSGKTNRVAGMRMLYAPLAMIVPALAIVVPLMLWNHARFGSLLNFGNAYQFSIADMTKYVTPTASVPVTAWYYLFLPMRFTAAFPWVAASAAPMPEWSYYEVMSGGLFVTMPLLALSLILPFLRRLEMHGMRALLLSCLGLAGVIIVFNSAVGGLGWRYTADFAYLLALASIPGLLWLVNGREPSTSLAGANDAASADGFAYVTPWRWLMRWAMLLAVLFMIAVSVLSCLMQGRSDALINNNPTLWHELQAWFTLL
ncbi:hypothetical protein [Bifidobacterium scaligerum]|nr:hypothetical protein [Bifidobacterium scaligerum]